MSFSLHAQNIKTSSITWSSSKITNYSTMETNEEVNNLLSNTTSSVVWKKSNGQNLQFTVGDVIGQWTNVNSNGQITYELSNDQSRGNITFMKTVDGIRARLILIDNSDQQTIHEFIIDSFLVQ